jgi:hypothetical protein
MAKAVKNITNDATADLSPVHYTFKLPVPLEDLQTYRSELDGILRKTERELSEIDFHLMTDAERRRLLGSGVRRWGFITKTFEVASDNPEFVPLFLDMENFGDLIAEINETRNITITLEQMLRIYTDILLIAGDDAYKLALMYYNSVRDAARRGVPGAQAIFRALQLFFRRGLRTDEQPTEAQTMRDVKAVLHGKKDGKIVIEGQAAHKTAAEKTVVDDVHKPHGAWKEKEHGIICEHCGCENHGHHRFCHGCGKELRIEN